MVTYKTPDVYIEEIPVFPPSVAEVGTAIPAFVGYAEKITLRKTNDLKLKPTKIYSLKEYESLFGFPKADTISVTVAANGAVTVADPAPKYLLYFTLKMFFDNGGTQAYVVAVDAYAEPSTVTKSDLIAGIDVVALEDEPTLLVVPEAVQLNATDYQEVVQKVLDQCGKLRDRFGIFDIHGGGASIDASLDAERGYFGMNSLKYGAAYFPFLKTSLNYYVDDTESNVQVTVGSASAAALGTFKTSSTGTATYNAVKAELPNHYLTLPPSGAVAGVYAAVDGARGVWKAPANVSLADVIEPSVKVTNAQQDNMNVDTNAGKSINVLRAFAGKGTLVWGARTLAGNDNEWRYISVRRFFNMVEESIKKSTYWAVFEPNDANTWVKVRGMIENYLIDKWRDGALAGAAPKDAFFVKCGLGVTMNAQDILEGRMNVEIGMAVVRPAEFIVLKFSHKMQTS